MKTEIKLLKEKAEAYGLMALSDKELIQILGYKGEPKDFFTSSLFLTMKEAVRRLYVTESTKITKSKDAYYILSFLEMQDHEQFWAIYTNRANRVIKTQLISKGGTTGTVVDIKIVLKHAIQLKASGIILAHNHPSGNMRPSQEDLNITKRLTEAAKFIDTAILDHLIIGNNEYYSLADNGHM